MTLRGNRKLIVVLSGIFVIPVLAALGAIGAAYIAVGTVASLYFLANTSNQWADKIKPPK